MTIRNPVEWGVNQVRLTVHAVGATSRAMHHARDHMDHAAPMVRRISIDDLKDALMKGFDDFAANRSDVIFLSLIYPLAGLLLAQMMLSQAMLPLIFPLVAGFALVSPFAATGLYEMSRRREMGQTPSWSDALSVFRSPSFGSIVLLGLGLIGMFLLWMLAAMSIYWLTFGAVVPASPIAFFQEVFTTSHGWALIAMGCGVGFLFALAVLAISAVSFPLLLDRQVSVSTAVRTSVRVMTENPVPMLAWGMIVAGSLVLGAIPALVGLIVVMPVLGHATWHLYRRAVM